MLNKLLNKAHSQKGITGLETAIILIAFVVVAAVFAYTVLSAGLFSSQKGEEAVYNALEETQSTLELRGGMTAYASETVVGADDNPEDIDLSGGDLAVDGYEAVTRLQFTVANALGGEAIDLTAPYTLTGNVDNDPGLIASAGSVHETIITYQDEDNFFKDCAYTVDWIGEYDGDAMLEPGEKAQITIWLVDKADADAFTLAAAASNSFFDDGDAANLLDTDHTFTVEVKTPRGAVLTMERTTPAELDPVMDFH